jgi:DNA-binding MltR family transcriptional regulator
MAKKQREKKNPEELGMEVVAAMDREFHVSSDRIVAIVGAAYLESILETLLREVFIDAPDEADQLLRPSAPLGSTGPRFQLAFCLGLITREQRDDLKLVAKIRNEFAHDFNIQSFDASPVREYCVSLQQPALIAAMPEKMFPADVAKQMSQYVRDTNATPREKFRTTIIGLFGSLLRRVNYVRRIEPGAWFSYDPDALVGPSAK